jgi:hypothetical protein
MPGRINRRQQYQRCSPAHYVVEAYDDTCGFWQEVQSVEVVWPTIYRRRWLRPGRLVLDVGNRITITNARRMAFTFASLKRYTQPTRIVEVKVNGSRYTIWERGKWLL